MIETIIVYAVLGGLSLFLAGVLVTFIVGLWAEMADHVGSRNIANQH